jgi:hypothetical protein
VIGAGFCETTHPGYAVLVGRAFIVAFTAVVRIPVEIYADAVAHGAAGIVTDTSPILAVLLTSAFDAAPAAILFVGLQIGTILAAVEVAHLAGADAPVAHLIVPASIVARTAVERIGEQVDAFLLAVDNATDHLVRTVAQRAVTVIASGPVLTLDPAGSAVVGVILEVDADTIAVAVMRFAVALAVDTVLERPAHIATVTAVPFIVLYVNTGAGALYIGGVGIVGTDSFLTTNGPGQQQQQCATDSYACPHR